MKASGCGAKGSERKSRPGSVAIDQFRESPRPGPLEETGERIHNDVFFVRHAARRSTELSTGHSDEAIKIPVP